jgi:pSer/pThr/pTyr-binding forkhead associated (FHA) protein
MTTTPTDRHTTALEQTLKLDALPGPADDERSTPTEHPAPGRYFAVQDAGREQLIQLQRTISHLGRGFTSDIQLEDQGVSRRHAIVMQRRGSVRILDDRSSNGTYVNGRRIVEAELHHGDVVVLGQTVLVFVDVPG